jgi:hypothetical protein
MPGTTVSKRLLMMFGQPLAHASSGKKNLVEMVTEGCWRRPDSTRSLLNLEYTPTA